MSAGALSSYADADSLARPEPVPESTVRVSRRAVDNLASAVNALGEILNRHGIAPAEAPTG